MPGGRGGLRRRAPRSRPARLPRRRAASPWCARASPAGRRWTGGWVFRLEGDDRWRRGLAPARLERRGGQAQQVRRRACTGAGSSWPAGRAGSRASRARGTPPRCYVNGRRVGRHVGNYLPFEVDLPAGRSTLTVRVSSLRTADDLTHWRPARFNRFGNGGWWNFGGIHREITVRPARGLDISRAQALPRLACPTCPARVRVLATVRNLTRRPVTPGGHAPARRAGPCRFPRVRLAPGQRRELAAELTIDRAAAVGHRPRQPVPAGRPGAGRRRAPPTPPGSASATCARTPRARCS